MSTNLVIDERPAITDRDIGELRRAVAWDHTPGAYDRSLPAAWSYFAARDEGGGLAAYVGVVSDGVADAFLVDLMVHPRFQRTGLGRALVERAARRVREAGIQCLHVTFNRELEPFYRAAGFHIFGGGIMDFGAPVNRTPSL